MHERRRTKRENTNDRDVRARVELADGTALEGLVADASPGGAQVSGGAAGLKEGDEIRLVYLFLSGEQGAHHARVRHVDMEQGCFGVEFLSDPVQIDSQRVGCDGPGNVLPRNPADSSDDKM